MDCSSICARLRPRWRPSACRRCARIFWSIPTRSWKRAPPERGVLVILRMLTRPRIEELLDVAAEHGMFVLLEAFDDVDLAMAHDLETARSAPSASHGAGGAEPVGGVQPILIGVNCRDLQTLTVVQERFAELAPLLPAGWPAVPQSGVA